MKALHFTMKYPDYCSSKLFRKIIHLSRDAYMEMIGDSVIIKNTKDETTWALFSVKTISFGYCWDNISNYILFSSRDLDKYFVFNTDSFNLKNMDRVVNSIPIKNENILHDIMKAIVKKDKCFVDHSKESIAFSIGLGNEEDRKVCISKKSFLDNPIMLDDKTWLITNYLSKVYTKIEFIERGGVMIPKDISPETSKAIMDFVNYDN